MFIIRSKRNSPGTIEHFSNGKGIIGSCVFPSREMAREVLIYLIQYYDGMGNDSGMFYIEEVPDDIYYQTFIDMPENKHLKRNYKINQIEE